MKDGYYLNDETFTTQLSEPEDGYAYYKDHTLVLNNFTSKWMDNAEQYIS